MFPMSDARYTRTAVALHWLLAFAILASLAVGTIMADMALSPTRLKLINWHKWAGIAILLLSAARLAWRLTHRPPPLPSTLAPWQARLAALTHGALYVLFFAVPLAGWAYSSAAGFPVVWFGLVPLPDLAPVDRELADVLKATHELLAWLLSALVLLHVAAALKHQWVDRDGLLARMSWRRRPR
jgi:cytochrome b561